MIDLLTHSIRLQNVSVVFIALILCPVAHSGCGLCQTPPHQLSHAVQEEDIYEAVIRSQMERWYRGYDKEEREAKEKWEKDSAEKMNFQVFLVSINGKDPSNEFLNRFKDVPRVVKKASSGYFKKEQSSGWLHDKESGKRAIEFNAGAITWKSDSFVEVGGGYHCGSRCAATYVFRLQLVSGKWAVKEAELGVVS